jgi:hypothetical protein
LLIGFLSLFLSVIGRDTDWMFKHATALPPFKNSFDSAALDSAAADLGRYNPALLTCCISLEANPV